jgi:hypothetical protein
MQTNENRMRIVMMIDFNVGMLIFEEGYPYMNNFHVPVKRDVKSAISVFPPKKNEPALARRDFMG